MQHVAQEMESGKAAAKQSHVEVSNQLLISSSPFLVRHPVYVPFMQPWMGSNSPCMVHAMELCRITYKGPFAFVRRSNLGLILRSSYLLSLLRHAS